MQLFGRAIAAPNLAVLCVESREPFMGKMYHKYSKEPVEFISYLQMMEALDDLCDTIGYPIREVTQRSFRKVKPTRRRNYREAKAVTDFEELAEKAGSEGTFMVHVQYRQNATWQGQVTWVEKKQTQVFRSALELMKLIDSALIDISESASE